MELKKHDDKEEDDDEDAEAYAVKEEKIHPKDFEGVEEIVAQAKECSVSTTAGSAFHPTCTATATSAATCSNVSLKKTLNIFFASQ